MDMSKKLLEKDCNSLAPYRNIDDSRRRIEEMLKKLPTDNEAIKTAVTIQSLIDRAEAILTDKHNCDSPGFALHDLTSPEEMISQAQGYLDIWESGQCPFWGEYAEPGFATHDHTFAVDDNGNLHCFYNRVKAAYCWMERAGSITGHAVTNDLIHWDILPPALGPTEGEFDNDQTWAPAVVRDSDWWWMFYTGVNENRCQGICAARSRNLIDWEKIGPRPLFVPGDWCYWDKATWSDCRDCFVLKDDDQWIMYYCTREKKEYGGRPAFGIAVSEDLLNWKEVNHFTPPRYGTMVESPFVMKRDNWYYFFYTKCGCGTAYFRSDNPFTGWECLNDEDEVVFPIVSCSEVLTYKGKEVMSAATRHHNELHFLAFYELFWHEDGTVSVENQIR